MSTVPQRRCISYLRQHSSGKSRWAVGVTPLQVLRNILGTKPEALVAADRACDRARGRGLGARAIIFLSSCEGEEGPRRPTLSSHSADRVIR
jgi:hypothetical protein